MAGDTQGGADEAALADLAALLRTTEGEAYDLTRLEPESTPLFNLDSIAAAVVDSHGETSFATPAFIGMEGPACVDAEIVRRVLHSDATVSAPVALAGAEESAVFLYARAERATGWRLPPGVHEAAVARPGQVVVLTSHAAHVTPPLEAACRAHGLNGLQTRVVTEIVRTGGVRPAAAAAGVSYNTAREALAEALARAGVRRLPALVTQLMSLAFGVLPDADASEVLGDLWGLTPRQAAIAGLVAGGASRKTAAAVLSVSEAVVRKDLERVHLMLQVSTASALSRKVVEARALRWLTEATGGQIGFADTAEPLLLVRRPDGRRIAVSDYGPSSGRPVLVVHSSTTTRVVARGLLRALHAEGYRPIAIDRPGFGLTDEIAGLEAGAHDPFAAATDDVVRVLDHLRIDRTDLVARGAAQFVLALHQAAPGRLGRVVLVNPDPHMAASGRGVGGVNLTKQAFQRNPAVIRLLAGPLTRGVTAEGFIRRLQRDVCGSPPDEAALQDPELTRDYFRAVRTFATGRHAGIINEQVAFARGTRPPTVRGTKGWTVLVGAHDFMHDPQRVAVYWRDVLPDAELRVIADAGRFLALSHPHHVVAALRREPPAGS